MSAPLETAMEEVNQTPPDKEDSSKPLSKKTAKKEAKKLEKQRARPETPELPISSLSLDDDPLSVNYGDVPLSDLQSKEVRDVEDWTAVKTLTEEMKDKFVLIRGRVHTIRAVGKKMAFLVLRDSGFTVQCVVTEEPDYVSRQMVRFVAGLSRESIVDMEGVVCVPGVPIKGATQPEALWPKYQNT